MHGDYQVPVRVEDGGTLGFGPWGSLGVMIHDLSDPANPKLLGRFQGPYKPGAIAFHGLDASRLDRGFIIAAPEARDADFVTPARRSLHCC